MVKNFGFGFYSILSLIDEVAKKYMDLNHQYYDDSLEYLRTKEGAEFRELLSSTLVQTMKSTPVKVNALKNSFLKVKQFGSGVVLEADENNAKLDDLKAFVEFFSTEVNNDFFEKKTKDYLDNITWIIVKIDTSVDMFFSLFYELNGRKKNNNFWNEKSELYFEKDLPKMDVNIKSISKDMYKLKELRKIRNAYIHKNGIADEFFCKDFNISEYFNQNSKILVYMTKVKTFFSSFYNVIRFILKDYKEVDIEKMINDFKYLEKVVKNYDTL